MPEAKFLRAGDTPFSLDELRGKWVWLYVGFANCPGACPLAMDVLADAYRALDKPERVQPVFLSVDPARDTPDELAAFVHSYHPGFMGMTGARTSIDAVTKTLGARYEIFPPSTPGGDYVVGHPDVFYLIDPAGRLAATYDAYAPDSAKKLAQDANAWPAPAIATATPQPTPTPGPLISPLPEPVPELPSTSSAWCGVGPASYSELALAPLMWRSRTLGSGTSVLPAATPMRMWATTAADWLWMFHGNVTPGYIRQDGPRGRSAPEITNWQMLMGSRFLGPGIVDVRAMTSLEPFTLLPGGSPQLFQTGETWRFQPIVDGRHPHDLIAELAARYTWNLDLRTSLFVYGGPAGEPALGPGAYMHRPSAADNSWSPLGHHMQDAGHTSYGVATLGARRDDFQLEASMFNGREPDEDRLDLDLAPLDSWAARISWFPGANWSLQASQGFLNEPEILYAGDVYRTTASATNVTPMSWGRLSTMFVWGQNLELHRAQPVALQSYGLEGQADFPAGDHIYGRFELADRVGLVTQDLTSRRVNALTLGWVRDLGLVERLAFGVGADATVYSLDNALVNAYGPNPVSFRIYLRARPPAMRPTTELSSGS